MTDRRGDLMLLQIAMFWSFLWLSNEVKFLLHHSALYLILHFFFLETTSLQVVVPNYRYGNLADLSVPYRDFQIILLFSALHLLPAVVLNDSILLSFSSLLFLLLIFEHCRLWGHTQSDTTEVT